MAETTIVGVDFSGAADRNATWVTKATLQNDTLIVNSCYRPSLARDKALQALEKLLRELLPCAVAALDFPFSVPQKFAEKLVPNPSTMPDVWRAVANIKDYSQFDKLRRCFVEHNGAMMRRGDAHFGGPFSPLKAVNPDMLPMTFYGMRMLHSLWQNSGCRIPPEPCGDRRGPILFETMPGVLLRIFVLPHEKYKKTYRDQKVARKNRETILAGLSDKKTTGVSLENLT